MLIHLIAEIKACHGQETQLENALRALLEPSRHEDGCCQYELFEDEAVPGLFIMQEIWCSQAALARHQQTEHFRNFVTITEQNGWIEYLTPRQLKFLA